MNQTKNCSKCDQKKPLTEYCKLTKSKDGFRPSCKECDHKVKKAYSIAHKTEISKQNKLYREKHRDELNKYHKEWYDKNLREQGKNSENKEYYAHYRHMVNNTQRERLKDDIAFKMKRNIGRMMKKFFKKDRATYQLIGCSSDMFQKWMKWQADIDDIEFTNYGREIHIDHVSPCASFDLSKVDQQRWCFHWSNLRCLPAVDNIVKSDTVNDWLIHKQELKAMCFLIHNKKEVQAGNLDLEFVTRID